MAFHVGFISTRFKGIDGVSLEASKWSQVFEESGYKCFWFAGELDRPAQSSLLVPEAHFLHHQNLEINSEISGNKCRSKNVTAKIHEQREYLKQQLHLFLEKFQIDLIVAENSLCLPMHIPLGLALTETIAETQIPTIAHHHDFYWERSRYTVNAVSDYIRMAFPPALPQINHVVINSEAREQLALRTGITSTIIPNVLDFDNPPQIDESSKNSLMTHLGLTKEDLVVLQPTRIVSRKGIEHAIDLVASLGKPNCKLVVSHESGDEGHEYMHYLNRYAETSGVELIMIPFGISDPWATSEDNESQFSLLDIYPIADFVTYPSRYEGFGNGLLEAIYFKKPILVNRYATFIRDIAPLGFELIEMDNYLDIPSINRTRDLLDYPELRQIIVDHNFDRAAKHFSYQVLRQRMGHIMNDLDLPWDYTTPDTKKTNSNKLVYLHDSGIGNGARAVASKKFA